MKKTFSVPAVGVSSLLTIFAVLCLTVFAVLSISTAQSDGRLSDSAHEAVLGYYQAEQEATLILSKLRSGEIPEQVKEENGIYSYTCAVSATQALRVEVSLDGTNYTLHRWQLVTTTQWENDTDLPVWQAD